MNIFVFFSMNILSCKNIEKNCVFQDTECLPFSVPVDDMSHEQIFI